MKTKYSIIFTLTILLFLKLNAQDINDISFAKSIFNNNADHKEKINTGSADKNPVHLVFTGLFVFYKHFISSQDFPSCNFTPSCSEYGLKAIKKKGLFVGILATFDRLSRCNNPDADGYEIDEKTQRLKDDP